MFASHWCFSPSLPFHTSSLTSFPLSLHLHPTSPLPSSAQFDFVPRLPAAGSPNAASPLLDLSPAVIDLLPSTTSLPAVAPPLDSAEREITRRLPIDTQGALVPLASAAQLSLRALHPLLPLLPLLGKALPPHRMERREADFLALPTPSDPLLSQEGYAVPGRSFTSAEFADPWVRIPLCTLNMANSLPPPLAATSLTLVRPLPPLPATPPSMHSILTSPASLLLPYSMHFFLTYLFIPLPPHPNRRSRASRIGRRPAGAQTTSCQPSRCASCWWLLSTA